MFEFRNLYLKTAASTPASNRAPRPKRTSRTGKTSQLGDRALYEYMQDITENGAAISILMDEYIDALLDLLSRWVDASPSRPIQQRKNDIQSRLTAKVSPPISLWPVWGQQK
jgi:hypothetical protein